jgi:UDP-N-acetylmuramoylalanine--D-glutamate ligase
LFLRPVRYQILSVVSLMDKRGYVLIQGLGLNQGGVGAARYFAEKGRHVLVTDLKTENELQPSVEALKKFKNIEFILGKHREKDFAEAGLVICSPAVPLENKYLKIGEENKIPVYCPMSYFFTHHHGRIIGVTGTRGKSTTANLIFQILKKAGKEVYLGGNIGRSVLDFLDQLNDEAISVLEISSFMLKWLEKVNQSPEISLLTNIYPDHLDYHSSMADYVDAKKQIFRDQKAGDIVFLNLDNPEIKRLKNQAPGKIKDFSSEKVNFQNLNLDIFHPLFGQHNRENIQAAVAVSRYMGVSEAVIEKTIENYDGLYGRQMFLGEFNGVKVVNDTCATIPEAVIVALDRFRQFSTILFAGGKDKGVDYSALAEKISNVRPKLVILLKSSAADKLKKELVKLDWSKFDEVDSLEKGIKLAMQAGENGDLFLFSPGGSSFERFANEFERGRRFDKLVTSR